MHGGLTLEQYATATAALRIASPERASALLSSFGVSARDWESIVEAWTRAIDDDMEHGEGELLRTYVAAMRAAAALASKEGGEVLPTRDSKSTGLAQTFALLGIAPSASPALPFEAPASETHGVSLLGYVELVSLLQAPGAYRETVLASKALTQEQFAEVEAQYQKKFAANGSLALEFGRLLSAAQRRVAEPVAASVLHTGTVQSIDVSEIADKRVPDLSVEQYAWVVGTLRRTPPDELPTALARLRLTPASRLELDRRWAARLRAEPAVREQYAVAIARYLPPDIRS